MGNALRDWGTAATLVAAALLQGGCKDSGNDELSKAARPIVSTPKLDLDATPNAVRDVLKAKAAAEEQPTVTETPADPPQVPQKKKSRLPKPPQAAMRQQRYRKISDKRILR